MVEECLKDAEALDSDSQSTRIWGGKVGVYGIACRPDFRPHPSLRVCPLFAKTINHKALRYHNPSPSPLHGNRLDDGYNRRTNKLALPAAKRFTRWGLRWMNDYTDECKVVGDGWRDVPGTYKHPNYGFRSEARSKDTDPSLPSMGRSSEQERFVQVIHWPFLPKSSESLPPLKGYEGAAPALGERWCGQSHGYDSTRVISMHEYFEGKSEPVPREWPGSMKDERRQQRPLYVFLLDLLPHILPLAGRFGRRRADAPVRQSTVIYVGWTRRREVNEL
ncbi:hypothetical protein CPC08DRAFT_755627 [Agrocybe pediades]|nr:hypothetical protein CPC08DRAFT_755627 [Agrocybe pediades]